MSKRYYQKKEEKNLPSETQNQLIIDSEDTYKDIENIFYVHPSHLNMLKSISNNQFTSVSIKNSSVDDISAYALMNLFGKLKTGAKVEMIIYQPISVMQEYDAKQIEASALLAGFTDVKINDISYVDSKTQRKMDTLSITFVKPEKRVPLKEEDIVITTTSNITQKSQKSSSISGRRRK